MESSRIIADLTSLPPEMQKQVADFIAFLKMRYATTGVSKSRRTRMAEEPFVGMWRGRKDMQDSTAWVRHLRQREWGRGT